MILKGFSTELEIGLLRLLFSDDHPDFVDCGSGLEKDTRWLAWHSLLTKNHSELTAWLEAITSEGFQSLMRYRLNECIAWGWLMQHDRKQITKMLNVLDASERQQMRQHLNNLKPFYKTWYQQQLNQQHIQIKTTGVAA
jgi:hypothetical protein